MVEDKVLYRYHSSYTTDGPWICVTRYKVIRETEKSYVIDGGYNYEKGKRMETFILKSHNGKRYAYDTLEAAYEGFLHRCRRRELITRSQWKRSEEVYKAAQNKEKMLSLPVGRYLL